MLLLNSQLFGIHLAYLIQLPNLNEFAVLDSVRDSALLGQLKPSNGAGECDLAPTGTFLKDEGSAEAG